MSMHLSEKDAILRRICDEVRGMTSDPIREVQARVVFSGYSPDCPPGPDYPVGVSVELADQRGYCAGSLGISIRSIPRSRRDVTIDDIRSGRASFGQKSLQYGPHLFYLQFSDTADGRIESEEEAIAGFRARLEQRSPMLYFKRAVLEESDAPQPPTHNPGKWGRRFDRVFELVFG